MPPSRNGRAFNFFHVVIAAIIVMAVECAFFVRESFRAIRSFFA
jgi:hypothetical protein